MPTPVSDANRTHTLFTVANLITLGSLAASLLAISQGIAGHFDRVGQLFLIAAICDALDGFVARRRQTAGPLGTQLDSLVDMVSFGVVPATVALSFAAQHGSALPFWLLAVYVACTAIRLGRFNVQADKSVFFGLNSPSAAALVIFLVWSMHDAGPVIASHWSITAVSVSLLFSALMMVSPFHYISTKKLTTTYPQTRLVLLLLAAALACTVAFAPYSLYLGALLYALSGPGNSLRRLRPRTA